MMKANILANTATKQELRSVIGDFNERGNLCLGNKVIARKKRNETIFYISRRKELLCRLVNGSYAVASDISGLNDMCISLGMNDNWTLEDYKAYLKTRELITAAPLIYDPKDVELEGQYVAGVQSFNEYGYDPIYLTSSVYDYLRKIETYLDRKIASNLKSRNLNKECIRKDYVIANQYSYPYYMEALNYDLETHEELSSAFERRLHL